MPRIPHRVVLSAIAESLPSGCETDRKYNKDETGQVGIVMHDHHPMQELSLCRKGLQERLEPRLLFLRRISFQVFDRKLAEKIPAIMNGKRGMCTMFIAALAPCIMSRERSSRCSISGLN